MNTKQNWKQKADPLVFTDSGFPHHKCLRKWQTTQHTSTHSVVKRGTLHNLTTDSCEYIQNVDNSHSTDIGDTWNVGNTHNTHRGEEGNLNNSPNSQIVVMIASGQYSQHAHTHTHTVMKTGKWTLHNTLQVWRWRRQEPKHNAPLVVPQKLKVVNDQLQTAPMEQSCSGKTMQCYECIDWEFQQTEHNRQCIYLTEWAWTRIENRKLTRYSLPIVVSRHKCWIKWQTIHTVVHTVWWRGELGIISLRTVVKWGTLHNVTTHSVVKEGNLAQHHYTQFWMHTKRGQ